MRTVVVTGASGALGQRVVRRLADRDDVRRVVAVDVVPLAEAPAAVESHVVELAEPQNGSARSDELVPLLREADGLVHLAWRVPGHNGAQAARVAESNQRALRRVLGAAEAASTPAVVHLSSATVYGAWPDNKIPLTEDAALRPNPGFRFAVGKAEAERLLAEWAEDHPGVRVAVLRPTVTVGSGHSENGALYEALGGTRAPSSGEDPARPVQFLHVDDLASAVVHAWEQGLAGVFNVAPDRGIGEDTARSLAGGVAKVPLPERLAHAVAIWSWDLSRRGVPRDALPYARWPWVVAPDKLAATGWRPSYSSEAALVVTDPRPHWDDLPPTS
ncbi:MAG: NAD-dependent epimerase/dehydratase family protein, partial [Acidimicrobiaceae bacterium]|nr:NAD-dependent epimerase/dehydratase family protein [Acidimicrobiaceae bacterium]